jgi:hypothetical protein
MSNTRFEESKIPEVLALLVEIRDGIAAINKSPQPSAQSSYPSVEDLAGAITHHVGLQISLPLTVNQIARAMIESENRGTVTLHRIGATVQVAPGATVVQNFQTDSLPTVMISDLDITSDTYSAAGLITVQAYVDGISVIMPSDSMMSIPLSGPISLQLGQFIVVQNTLQVILTNNTAGTINVTVGQEHVHMTQGFYLDTFRPILLQFGFRALHGLLQSPILTVHGGV